MPATGAIHCTCRTRGGSLLGIAAAAALTLAGLGLTIFSWHRLLGRYFGETTGTQAFLLLFALVVAAATFGVAGREAWVSPAEGVRLRRRWLFFRGPAVAIPGAQVRRVLLHYGDVGACVLLQTAAQERPLMLAEGHPETMLKLAREIAAALGKAAVSESAWE